MLIPVAVQSKAYVCGRLIAEIAGSNPAEGMHVFVVCFLGVLPGVCVCVCNCA